jgi:hypothetical protein
MTEFDAHSIDWEHWRRLDRWLLGEAVLLLVSINPSEAASLDGRSPLTDEERGAMEEAVRIEKYAWASYHAHKLVIRVPDWGPPSVAPTEWLRWARTKGLRIPPQLADLDADSTVGARVDYVAWKKRDLWTLVEAAFLLARMEPLLVDNVVGDTEASHRYRDLKDAVTLKKLQDYGSRTGKVGGTLVRPTECIRWALDRGDDVPEALKDLAQAQLDKPLHSKEKDTLLKLVIGMAVKGFDYDPAAARSDVPTEIAAALDGLGIGIDVGTVRKWLAFGAELLPKESGRHGG